MADIETTCFLNIDRVKEEKSRTLEYQCEQNKKMQM